MQLPRTDLAGRLAVLALGAAALVAGIAGGLGRLGLAVPAPLANATALHGTLMIGGFLGTVIGIERAVALGRRIGFLGPLVSGLGTLALIAGQVQAGAWLLVYAAVVHVAVTSRLALRQVSQHTLMLVPASAAWLVANLLFALGVSVEGAIAWGFDFLLFTIAAERLDMARLVKRAAPAGPLLVAACGAVLVASAWIVFDPRAGGAFYGAALVAMAAWFAVFDVARRTVRTHGLGQYAAACILGGYAWLAVAGVAWAGMGAFGWPTRDLALHALGLGFVMSMILGHAPIIAPAIARVKCAFGAWFYLAPAALHASLLVRFVPGFDDAAARAWGGLLNVAALLAFAATMARSIQLGLRIFPRPKRPPPGYVHERPARQHPS